MGKSGRPSGRIIRGVPDRNSDIQEKLRHFLITGKDEGRLVYSTEELMPILDKDARRANQYLARWPLVVEESPGASRGQERRWRTVISDAES